MRAPVVSGVVSRITFGLVAALAVACAEAVESGPPDPLNFTLAPERATVAAGDSVALTLQGEGRTAARWALRWRSDRPDVVRLDTTVVAGRPVYARGVAAGEAMIRFELSYEGQTVTGEVPVAVTATAPPPATFVGPAWEVVAVDGHALPQTLSVLGRGTCVDRPLYRSRVAFLGDGTFEHQLWLAPDTTTTPSVFRTGYTLLPDGTAALSIGTETARIRRDTLRVHLAVGLLCGTHELVAVRGR